MTHRDRALQIAADCQRLARALAPYQNKPRTAVVDAAKIPPSPLLREMTDKLNAVRAEYGLPAVAPEPMLTAAFVEEITCALLSAGNTLEHEFNPRPSPTGVPT